MKISTVIVRHASVFCYCSRRMAVFSPALLRKILYRCFLWHTSYSVIKTSLVSSIKTLIMLVFLYTAAVWIGLKSKFAFVHFFLLLLFLLKLYMKSKTFNNKHVIGQHGVHSKLQNNIRKYDQKRKKETVTCSEWRVLNTNHLASG